MSETEPQDQPDEAMVDLLIKQVTEGLSPAEQRELDVLDSAVASAYARDLERAAAAVALAAAPAAEPLPAALRARIEADARAFMSSAAAGAAASSGAAQDGVDSRLPQSRPGASARPSVRAADPRATPARSGRAGWWAAAACLVLALVGWLRAPTLTGPPAAQVTVESPPPSTPIPPPAPPPPTPAEQRDALLARPDSMKINLGLTKDPAAAGASGDVVWDPATQQGFARFSGLKPNDPKQQQYQLWIFDGERDQRYPVDGGVFDVPGNVSEVIVPIRAALLVHAAKAFAVTVEKPGGAVVSARDRVVALGKAS